MRRIARGFLTILTLAAWLALPDAAGAVGYEDSLDDCAYPETFDAIVLRPVGIATTIAGTALFVPTAVIALITVPGEMGKVTENLIYAPARFTFKRKLGECTGTSVAY